MALTQAHLIAPLIRGSTSCLLRFVSAKSASHGGAVPNSSPQQGATALDPYSEKLQDKGTKELEQLTGQHDAQDDDWVDVRTATLNTSLLMFWLACRTA